MIKPDGVRMGLTEEIVRRIQDKGFEIKLFDVRKLTGEILDEHYAHVADKPFYPGMKELLCSTYDSIWRKCSSRNERFNGSY